ncbi:enoyl-CoA hydratase-related protein (plasmid) [Salipiger sp. H15]|uniref:Enoyl-CoA hydratase-related protein n=1 Tax=Alloyangia sp. H15 TaxID=3029062 RepID=A0AAU8ASK4_9RHOB
MSAPHLIEERRGPVLLLTLNRPAVRNAISPEMACRLADAFAAFDADDALRVAILTGAGDLAFCAGGDLGRTLPLLSGDRAPEDDWDRRFLNDPEVQDRSALRRNVPAKPVIAAINGLCLAGGMETMLGTDLRIASEDAVFGLPEARRGVIPFAGALVRLARQIPEPVAMELLLTGGTIDAARAHALGLVNRVVPQGEVLARAFEMAEVLAANGPVSLREIKRVVLGSSGLPLDEGFAMEDEAKRIVMASEDAREGPRAFMEKRRPRFVGR